jgi:hemerythrin-like domain-containing protein
MRAMLRYIRDFPVALHHPKEERLLFDRLRERTAAFDADLDELSRQQQRDHVLVAELAALVERQATAAPGDQAAALAALDAAVAAYSAFIWDHLGREEAVILPAAQQHLQAEDWAALDAAFSANDDPHFGEPERDEFRLLFSRIVNLVPPVPG